MKKQKRSAPKPRPSKQIFIQEVDPYRKEIIVATGHSIAEIAAYAKKMRAEKWMLDWLEKNDKELTEQIARGSLGFLAVEDHGAALLWLKPYEDTWSYWECLIHELNHYGYLVLDKKLGMDGETEAHAYMQEHLFRSIRRKLQGLDSHGD